MLTQARLKELFRYNDGVLYWKVNKGPAKAGDAAGFQIEYGYTMMCADRVHCYRHRLVFIYHHGYSPESRLDHIDQDPTNDRIENLREISHACNLRNSGNPKNNTHGVRGVAWDIEHKKWRAQITMMYKQIYLGLSVDFTEAVCHRLAGEQSLGWYKCAISSPAHQYIKNLIPSIK